MISGSQSVPTRSLFILSEQPRGDKSRFLAEAGYTKAKRWSR